MQKDLQISLLGELRVTLDGSEVALPASKKARALLAFLVATDRPHRRERLCELFWDLPDDPKAALRWALSKLRSAGGAAEDSRIVADRERVHFDTEGVEVDIKTIYARLRDVDDTPSIAQLAAMAERLDRVFLDGLDCVFHDMWPPGPRACGQSFHDMWPHP